jgi:hypothetical protein
MGKEEGGKRKEERPDVPDGSALAVRGPSELASPVAGESTTGTVVTLMPETGMPLPMPPPPYSTELCVFGGHLVIKMSCPNAAELLVMAGLIQRVVEINKHLVLVSAPEKARNKGGGRGGCGCG